MALNVGRDILDEKSMRVLLRPRALAAILLTCILAARVDALAAVNPEFGYSIDLPVGWVEADNSDPHHIGFLSPNADAMIQIIALDPATGATGLELAEFMLSQLGGEGESESFDYQARSAALTDVAFTTSGLDVQGYLITIDGAETDLALLAFAVLESYEVAHDHLVSALDSFAIGPESRAYPGPVSQFFYPFPAPATRDESIPFLDARLPFAYDPDEEEASRVLVDREARVLEPYGRLDRELATEAWRRYFRMIYRDNYMRLAPIAESVGALLEAERIPRVDYPSEILAWLQGFDYERAGGLSDFAPPIACLASSSGDCDSLALTYVIILHHLGFDAILMVSDRYSHALAAVDVQGPGARFAFEDRQWLVAELTEEVAIGQIAATMADPAGWIGVRLRLR